MFPRCVHLGKTNTTLFFLCSSPLRLNLHVFTRFNLIRKAGYISAPSICNVISWLSLFGRCCCIFFNSSGKIPMMVPCMKSSSEMQIRASVLLKEAERFIRGRFLRRDPAVGQSWFLCCQREWVWSKELFLMGVTMSNVQESQTL